MDQKFEEKVLSRLKAFSGDLESKEAISKKYNCRKVKLDLKPANYSPELVKATRQILEASQSIFAKFLGVSVGTVQSWERGENSPQPMACRFMDEIRHDPNRWKERLKELVIPKVTTPC